MAFKHVVRHYATQRNLYEVLELPPGAGMQDVKRQFKVLSKKYHPDVNLHLDPEAQDRNRQKYVAMVLAYDTLKDAAKKTEYDASLSPAAGPVRHARPSWHSDRYGDASPYSRGSALRKSPSGYSYARHRVYNFYTGEGGNELHFSGMHRSHDRFDVPHFDYNEHLSKLLKFEQRIINKRLSDADREAIIRQLAPDGDISKINEETFTKHLMRQARSGPAAAHVRSHVTQPTSHSHMYQGTSDSSFGLTAVLLAGGAGLVYLIYQALT